jgi:hypothetical protein
MSPDLIIDTVCEYYCAKRSVVLGKSRRYDVRFMRQVAMYLCREELGYAYATISFFFGGTHHTTVIHAHQQIVQAESKDKRVSEQLADIRAAIARKNDDRRSINYGGGIPQEQGSANASTYQEVLARAEVGEGESGSIKRWRACRLHNRGSFFVSRLRHDHPQLV